MTESGNARRVLVATPTYDQRMATKTHVAVLNCGSLAPQGPKLRVKTCDYAGSLLPVVFNHAWMDAIEDGFDLFAMVHADVAPEPGWLSKLVRILDEEDADLVSCVIAIKDDSSETSTGRYFGADGASLSYADIERLPPIFGIGDIQELYPDTKCMLVNTGCWVARVDRPWCKRFSGFRIDCRIDWNRPKGERLNVISEDYGMSLELARMDPAPRVLATSLIRVQHLGLKWWDSPRSGFGTDIEKFYARED